MDEPVKQCSRCPEGQNIKPISQFFKNKSYKDGLFPYCKECHKQVAARPEFVAKRKAYKATYHCKNADKINARSIQWAKDHPEQFRARQNRWKREHKAQVLAAAAVYRAIHRIACRLRAQKSRRKKPAFYAARRKEWRQQNRNKVTEYQHQRRARMQNIPIIDFVEVAILFKRDKGICGICNERITRLKDASRDHIIPITIEGSEHSYRNMVIAHKWCNSFKGNRLVLQQLRLF